MKMGEIFVPHSKSIKQIFEGSTYYQVPPYQRPYSWKEEHVEELWEDIYSAFENGDEEYFLGSLILTRNKENKCLDVIDGQQRITTLTILFCVLRDMYYIDLENKTEKKKIIGRIRDLESENERLKFRTHPGSQNDFEQEIIKKINFEKEGKRSKFLDAAHVFREKINTLLEKDKTLLEKFTDYLLEKVMVVTIECTNKSFAIKLFQVLNTRGLDLSPADLIKSFLMSKLKTKEDSETFEHEWNDIENKSKNLNEDLKNLFTYYEYYLLASNPKKSLYEELEKKFKNREPLEVIHEFKRLIKYFEDIKSHKLKSVYALNYLKHDVYWKSILLAAKLKEWPETEFEKLTEKIRNFFYLYWIAEYTSTRIKQTSFNIISLIKNGNTLDQITEELEEKLTEDRVVKRALRNIKEGAYNAAWCKPLLILLEYYQTDDSNINFIELDKMLQVEHILPQSYSKVSYWSERFSHQKAERLVNTLGNLTLLSGRKNILASNKPFPDKVNNYKGKGMDGITAFQITQRIFQETKNDAEWTEENINERQEWLTKELGSLFNIDVNQDLSEEEEENELENYVDVDEINEKLTEKILELDPRIKKNPKKNYVGFNKDSTINFTRLILRKDHVRVRILVGKDKLTDEKEITQDKTSDEFKETRKLFFKVKSLNEIDYAMYLIKQSHKFNESLVEKTLDVTPIHNARKLFWTQLLEKAKEKNADFQNLSPGHYHWIGKGSGKSGVHFNFVVLNEKPRIEVYIDGGNKEQNKKWFDELFSNKKAIEKSFGEEIEWWRLNDKRASGISKNYIDNGLNHPKKWDELQEKMVEDMIRLENTFRKFIMELD
jgi:uncharacterized protein with ParB-like and HNH nuclease domain/predicted transport protein